MSQRLSHARRMVIKIGSALLIDKKTGALRQDWLKSLAADIAGMKERGQEIVIVSSGAIALGRSRLGKKGALRLEESQAAAAIGQIDLAHAWSRAMSAHNMTIAQVLLTLGDTEERRRYLNARGTIETLLGLGAIPVINENDTVATTEIRYGDNDRLAARVASMISADCLVLLSDVDGLYRENPAINPDAEHLPEVTEITPAIEAMAAPPPERSETNLGSGGMQTKISAAKIATAAGCHMVIASGKTLAPLSAIETGARTTWFTAQDNPRAARKRWIAGSLSPQGTLTIDAGAAKALQKGNSLLPAGITSSSGGFDRGDAVLVIGPDGEEIARGLSAYPADEAQQIIGLKSSDIETRLGYRGRTAMIHRDDLVLTGSQITTRKEPA
ncbi:MAG: glutamate 5-kinase [Alphaproteobacteria bacterium]|nr:MAG: glutamate 5-kinase [Alphaproteobacteria bacterium]